MQNRQSGGRRRRGGGGGGGGGNGANPRPMGQPMGGQSANRLEVRVRGNAHQLLEKYKQLARDAHQAGDRVAAEYYLQHSDHYFRVLNDSRIRQEEMRARRSVFDQFEDGSQDDGDDMQGDGGEEQADERPRQPQPQPQARAEAERPRRYEPREPREVREPREPRDPRDLRDRPERAERQDRFEPRADAQDDGERQPRFQERRPERVREDRKPRATADADETRLSDGEAALVAFGGVPVREPAPVPDVEAAEAEAPKPRRRGRPRKVDAEPVEG
ncbi:MAG: DUF4167 domain-containing protein [Sandaracinobacteroides sp.]